MKTSKTAITALSYLFFITLLTGLLYPLAVTLAANLFFPIQANGSLIMSGDTVRGSFLIGQEFKSEIFFHGRPSFSSYDPMAAGASNLSATSKALAEEVAKRRTAWIKTCGTGGIPEEMLYASASGLDPEISRKAALLQIERISKARGYGEMQKSRLKEYIKLKTDPGNTTAIHKPYLNVVKLDLMLENEFQNEKKGYDKIIVGKGGTP
jgi:K+-transporting ATPase ATPase C chain